jgi:hypothetical protein
MGGGSGGRLEHFDPACLEPWLAERHREEFGPKARADNDLSWPPCGKVA